MAKWLEYFRNPRNIGPLDPAVVGEAGGGCGDLVRLYLAIENEVVVSAAFLASGCPGAIAGASACAEIVTGMAIPEAAAVGAGAIERRLADLPAAKRACLELSATALALALERHAGTGMKLPPVDRTVVAMSGGVDSSTAAAKLHGDGLDIFGVTLRLHDCAAPSPRACCTPADIDDARAVAFKVGFPHLVLDMRGEFKAEVIDRFCAAYLAGRTPNPCVECNRRLRFTHLLDKATALGGAKVATGHYVRIAGPDTVGRYELRRGRDRSKDQSYMFWAATQHVLSSFIAPLGDLRKDEVRELAAAFDLGVAAKVDSQDVCFVPDGDYAAFVRRETGHVPSPGPIVDTAGTIIGEHRGLINYTVGQRKRLRVSSLKPMYVLRLDVNENTLHVGDGAKLAVDRFEVREMNLITPDPTGASFSAEVMIRYNSRVKEAVIHPTAEDAAIVEFHEAYGPIAPGQSAVFYDGDLVLGGGIIM